jgi:tRNA dimethylallyltransferase
MQKDISQKKSDASGTECAAIRRKVPFLVGPTASGKTELALLLARTLKAQIISADSRQLFRGLRIGTAQPTPDQLAAVPHHFVDCIEPTESFSAGEYGRQARALIERLLQEAITPLVVGGSGLYISALADDFFTGPSADPEFRARLRRRRDREGTAVLHRELQQIDPISAEKIMISDYRRIERALEIYHLTGIPISILRRKKSNPPPYQPVIVGLHWERPKLYERINLRCRRMLDDGLIEEVQRLTASGLTPENCIALDSVGYKEIFAYLQGTVDEAEMLRLFQRNTRRFAKRQLSWFHRDDRIHWIHRDEARSVPQIVQEILRVYKNSGIILD